MVTVIDGHASGDSVSSYTPKDEWWFITITLQTTDRDEPLLNFYANGNLVLSTYIEFPNTSNISLEWLFGKRYGNLAYWNGVISELKIENSALSPDEIKKRFDPSNGGQETGQSDVNTIIQVFTVAAIIIVGATTTLIIRDYVNNREKKEI